MPRVLANPSLLISSDHSRFFSSSASQALPLHFQQQALHLSSSSRLGFGYQQQQEQEPQEQKNQALAIREAEDSAAGAPSGSRFSESLALERPTAASLDTAMIIHRERGRIDEAVRVWEDFRVMRVLPSFISYCIAVSLFQSRKDAKRALRAYRDARQQFLGVDSTGIPCKIKVPAPAASDSEVNRVIALDAQRSRKVGAFLPADSSTGQEPAALAQAVAESGGFWQSDEQKSGAFSQADDSIPQETGAFFQADDSPSQESGGFSQPDGAETGAFGHRDQEIRVFFQPEQETGAFSQPDEAETGAFGHRDQEIRAFLQPEQEPGAFSQPDESTSDAETAAAIDKLGSAVLALCLDHLRSSLASDGNRFPLQNLLRKMQYARLEIPARDCSRLLLLCGVHPNDHTILRSIHAYMLQRRILTPDLCNHAIRVLGFHRRFWSALAVYESMDRPNNETFSLLRSHFAALIAAGKRKNQWKWCLRLLQKMEERRIRPGKSSWDSAITACARAGRVEESVALFQRMIHWRYKPDIRSYSALLSALEKKALTEEMNRVLLSMKNSGVRLTESVYTTLISAHGKNRRLDEVARLTEEMNRVRVPMTVVTYNAVLTACAAAGDGERAVEWMRRMREAEVEPNWISYSKVVEALAAANRWREAAEAYRFMVRAGMRRSPVAYDAVVSVCRLNGVPVPCEWIGARPRRGKPS